MNTDKNYLFKKNGCFFFGVELTSFLTSRVQNKDHIQHVNSLRNCRLEFLNSVINPADENLTYDFRIIFVPGKPFPALSFVYLVRYRVKEASKALTYLNSFYNLLQTYFPDISVELLTSEKIKFFLNPFPAKYLYETRRRSDRISLDTLKVPVESKFSKQGYTKKTEDKSIVHIFRFIPSFSMYDKFIKILYTENKPVLISCMLKPTKFKNNLIDFFEKQIIRCEKYAQIGISSLSGDIDSLFPTLREQAHLYQNEILKFYYGLKDNCALLQVRFAGSETISPFLLESFNILLTEPAGSFSITEISQVRNYLCGGYLTTVLEAEEQKQNLKGLTELDINLNSNELLDEQYKELFYLFDSNEAASAFKPPFFIGENIPGVKVRNFKFYEIPYNYVAPGVVIGMGRLNNKKIKIRISDEDRRRHMYIVGQTGTGKSTLIKQMIISDLEDGKGLCLLDPHGDLYNDVLSSIPEHRVDDIVIIDPNDIDYPVGMNILECPDNEQTHFVAQELVDIITKLLVDDFGENTLGQIAGPVFFQHMKMNLLLCMSDKNNPGTLLEFYQIFDHKSYWQRWMPLKVTDPLVQNWVKNILPNIDYTRISSESGSMGGYIGSKFSNFVFEPKLRNIFAQKKSTFSFKEIMDKSKVVLVNLAKGELTESTSKFFGMIILAKIQAELMQRLSTPPEQRINFNLYVDEFQSIATKNFISLLSEGRKFGISLILSNQFLFQVNTSIMNSIFGNCGTTVCFRLGMQDAEVIEKKFHPSFNSTDLMNFPNWTACISTLENGQIVPPFSLETIHTTTKRENSKKDLIIKASRSKYSMNKEDVEKEIEASL